MLKKMTILLALLALILVNLLKAQASAPVTTVLEATSVEESRDPTMPPSTELPLYYSTDPHKEEGLSQVGNTGVQEGEETTWELSGEPTSEFAPEPSVKPSKEPAQESTTEISE